MRMLLSIFALATFSLGATLATPAFAAQSYPGVESWPRDIDKTPCEIWEKKPDGTWTQTQPVQIGSMNYWGYWFKNNQYSQILDRKCGG